MTAQTLCINAGSSSVKYALFDEHGVGLANFDDHFESAASDQDLTATAELSLNRAIDGFKNAGFRLAHSTTCAHRFVFGGKKFTGAVLVDQHILIELESLAKFAPLHMPPALAFLRAAQAHMPEATITGHFDTAFHHTIPKINQAFALPERYYQEGLRRFGFHGLSYAYISQQLPILSKKADGCWIVAHLGSGASLCGIENRQSQICTMGFSPLDGLAMASRSGQLDPGAIIHLLRNENLNLDTLEHLLYKESGLLGLSEQTGDWRELSKLCDDKSNFAKAYFIEQIVQHIGKIIAHLQGIDGIVFTGGIGQNDIQCVSTILGKLQWLGVRQKPTNSLSTHDLPQKLSSPDSKIEAWVVATNEATVMADESRQLTQTTNDYQRYSE